MLTFLELLGDKLPKIQETELEVEAYELRPSMDFYELLKTNLRLILGVFIL
jgi:hypothetical protein